MQALTHWMRTHPQGGLVVFITSDTDFLNEVKTVYEADGFSAELLYLKEGYTTGPGMRDKVVRHYEWMEWLRDSMQMPHLEMHAFSASERQSPPRQAGKLQSVAVCGMSSAQQLTYMFAMPEIVCDIVSLKVPSAKLHYVYTRDFSPSYTFAPLALTPLQPLTGSSHL